MVRSTAQPRPTAGSWAPTCTGCSAGPTKIAYGDLIERTLDALAAHLAAHLDLDRLLTLAR
jgi:hypothetical protein